MAPKSVISVSVLMLFVIVVVSGCVQQPIGGETDEHGCLVAAGYSWNDSLGFCLREWELDESQREAAGIVVAPLSFYVTLTGVDVARCPGCFVVHLQRNDNRQMIHITLENWKIKPEGGDAQNKDCVNDEDCAVFGGTGDCNCGCFSKDSQWEPGGECFCLAPTSCECVNGRCEGVFSDLEQACIDSGGTVITSLCCKSSGDFPNMCLIGPCGCAPDQSHEVKICDCGEGKCFDGSGCVETL